MPINQNGNAYQNEKLIVKMIAKTNDAKIKKNFRYIFIINMCLFYVLLMYNIKVLFEIRFVINNDNVLTNRYRMIVRIDILEFLRK